MQPDSEQLVVPLHLLAFQMVGIVLAGLGAADLAGVSFVPADVLFPNQGLVLMIVGIALAGPGALLTVKQAKGRARARSGASVDPVDVIEPQTRNLSQPPLTLAARDRPWLKKKQWAARKIHSEPPGLRVLYLALAYIFFGGPAVAVVWAGSNNSPPMWGEILLAGGASILLLGFLTWLWLRSWLPWRRYGRSICRLITLPGVAGGWFKADVECRLPDDPTEPIVVRLKNCVYNGAETPTEVWRMEQKLTSVPAPRDPQARCIVPVRLRVPRHEKQVPIPIKTSWLKGVPVWHLEIEKKAPGADFYALFNVPIYDAAYGDPAEQRPY